MVLTYKYRLRPTEKQAYILNELLFQMQQVYNDALNERFWYWRRSRRSINYYDQWARFRELRREFPDEMGLLNVSSVQRTLRRVDSIFKQFYKGKRGRPRFKSARRFKSVEYTYGDGVKRKEGKLYVQNVGEIALWMHRDIPEGAKIKTAIIKRSLGKWYVFLTVEIEFPAAVPTSSEVGIDVGLKSLLALSNGTLIENPHWLRQSLTKLRRLQRKLSRQKKYSNGWRKTAYQIAKLHEHIANQRRDFWHKTTSEIVQRFGLIAVEDLNLAFMLRNGHLSLSAHDAGLGMFFELLEYKAEKAGARLVKVNPKNTSQVCSRCGAVVEKDLSVRVHVCPECGLHLDRDVNAALNILALGRSAETLTWPVTACVVSEAPPL